MVGRALLTSNKSDWETPPKLIEFLQNYLISTPMDWDACANKKNTKFPGYWNEKQDALKQSWEGKHIWMNPPYGRSIGRWTQKANEETLKHKSTSVVALLPARTDTAYWHQDVMGHAPTYVFFIKGRIKFVGAESGAPFPSAIVVWGVEHSIHSALYLTKEHRGY